MPSIGRNLDHCNQSRCLNPSHFLERCPETYPLFLVLVRSSHEVRVLQGSPIILFARWDQVRRWHSVSGVFDGVASEMLFARPGMRAYRNISHWKGIPLSLDQSTCRLLHWNEPEMNFRQQTTLKIAICVHCTLKEQFSVRFSLAFSVVSVCINNNFIWFPIKRSPKILCDFIYLLSNLHKFGVIFECQPFHCWSYFPPNHKDANTFENH